jgi:hypothetical protein
MNNTNVINIPKCDKERKWKFSELLAEQNVRLRWEKVRKYFFLRESTYDMTNRCNIRCDGCYYYEGEKQFAEENGDPEAWRKLMKEEKARGITYVVLAGAEPSMVPQLLEVCYGEIPLGCIATNGFKRISEAIGYKIHISVWGNDETSLRVRRAKQLLTKQIDNYRGDPRAVFIYTFTRNNIDEVYEVMDTIIRHDCKITFNIFHLLSTLPVRSGTTGILLIGPEKSCWIFCIDILKMCFIPPTAWLLIPINMAFTIFMDVRIREGILRRISVSDVHSGSTGRIYPGTGTSPAVFPTQTVTIAGIMPPAAPSSRHACIVT